MTLEEGLELINNYKKGLEKFLETLPEQSVSYTHLTLPTSDLV